MVERTVENPPAWPRPGQRFKVPAGIHPAALDVVHGPLNPPITIRHLQLRSPV